MIKPILVGILRFSCVVLFGYLAVSRNLSVDYVLYSVSFGLIITGVGMFLCLLGKEWKGLWLSYKQSYFLKIKIFQI